MTGLLTHYEVFRNRNSLNAAIKCGEWLLNRYGMVSGADHPFFRSTMEGGVNTSIVDQVIRLYACTGERKFLDFASSVIANFAPIERMRNTYQAPLWHAYNLAGFLGGVVSLAAIDGRDDELQWVEKVWEDLTPASLSTARWIQRALRASDQTTRRSKTVSHPAITRRPAPRWGSS
jgi:hypothetical protein